MVRGRPRVRRRLYVPRARPRVRAVPVDARAARAAARDLVRAAARGAPVVPAGRVRPGLGELEERAIEAHGRNLVDMDGVLDIMGRRREDLAQFRRQAVPEEVQRDLDIFRRWRHERELPRDPTGPRLELTTARGRERTHTRIRRALDHGVSYHLRMTADQQLNVIPENIPTIIATSINGFQPRLIAEEHQTGRVQVIINATYQMIELDANRLRAGPGVANRMLLLSMDYRDGEPYDRWIQLMNHRLTTWINGNDSPPLVPRIFDMVFTIFPLPARGGCETRRWLTGQVKGAFHYKSPPSTGNNCLIVCLRKASESLSGIPNSIPSTVRSLLGIAPDVLISFSDATVMDKLATFYRVHLRVFDAQKRLLAEYNQSAGEVPCDVFFTVLDPTNMTAMRDESVMVFGGKSRQSESTSSRRWKQARPAQGHYALITEWIASQNCAACGQTYLRRHDCNSEVARYYQTMFGEGRYLRPNMKRVFRVAVEDASQICRKGIVFADFETMPSEDGLHERPYAYGVLNTDSLSDADYRLLLEPNRVLDTDRGRVLQLPTTYYGGKETLQHFAQHVMAPMQNQRLVFYNGSRFDVPIALAEILDSEDFLVHRILMSSGRILALLFISTSKVSQEVTQRLRDLDRLIERLRDMTDTTNRTAAQCLLPSYSMTVEELESDDFEDGVLEADESTVNLFMQDLDKKRVEYLMDENDFRLACDLSLAEINRKRIVDSRMNGKQEISYTYLLKIPSIDGKVRLSHIQKIQLSRCLRGTMQAIEQEVGFNSVWDTYLFTQPNSLSAAASSFGVPAWAGKGDFNHDLIHGEEDVTRYKSLIDIYLRKDLLALAILTVRFTTECCVTFQRAFKGQGFRTLVSPGDEKKQKVEVRGPNVLDFMTMGQFTFDLWKCWSPEAWRIQLLRLDQWKFAKQAIYGGQVHASMEEVNHFDNDSEKKFVFQLAEQWRRLEADRERLHKNIRTLPDGRMTERTPAEQREWEFLNSVEERLRLQGLHLYHRHPTNFNVKVDANSLYPSVMATEDYTTEMQWMDSKSLQAPGIAHRFNTQPESIERGIYLVHIWPNSRWTHPLLPYRACHDYKLKEEDGSGEMVYLAEHSLNSAHSRDVGLHWNTLPRVGFYTSIDLTYAIRHGARVERIYRALQSVRLGPIFREYIGFVSKQRQEASARGDKVKKEILKIAMNSLYGKMAQKAIFTRQRILYGVKDWVDFNQVCELVSCRELQDGRLLVEGTLRSVLHRGETIRKPYQVAAEILSFSKRLMNEAIRLFNPTFCEHVASYGDTDSISGPSWIERVFEEAKLMHPTALCKFKNEYNEYDAKGAVTRRGRCLYEKNHGLKDYGGLVVYSDGGFKSFLKAKGIPLGKQSYSLDETTGQVVGQGQIGRVIPISQFMDGDQVETTFLSFKRYLPNRVTSLSNGLLSAIQRQLVSRKMHKSGYDRWSTDPISRYRYPPGHPMQVTLDKEEEESNMELDEEEEETISDLLDQLASDESDREDDFKLLLLE